MRISSQQDVDVVNARFNHFHDGFIKQIRVTSDNEFLTDPPWESQRQFPSNEEELLATGLYYLNSITVEIVIHHYNYDWPNQPRRREIVIRARSARVPENLLSFLGDDVFDLSFIKEAGGITCQFTYQEHRASIVRRSMENGTKIDVISASEMELEEAIWAEQSPPGDDPKTASEE